MVLELEPSLMALKTQATQTGSSSSSQRELTLMEDPRSPFFLHCDQVRFWLLNH